MPTKKKTTKKYDLSRAAIVERIQEIVDRLNELDTYATAPSDVSESVSDAVDDLEQLQSEVTDEAW